QPAQPAAPRTAFRAAGVSASVQHLVLVSCPADSLIYFGPFSRPASLGLLAMVPAMPRRHALQDEKSGAESIRESTGRDTDPLARVPRARGMPVQPGAPPAGGPERVPSRMIASPAPACQGHCPRFARRRA